MPRFRFDKDFDFDPPAYKGMVTKAYKAGATELVTQECAEAAKAAGVGEEAADRPDTKAAKADGAK